MLGKIFKYDLKATLRSFLPMYAALAILTVFNKLFLEFIPFDSSNNILNAIKGTFLLFYVLMLISLFLLNFVFIVVHFYKRMTGDEAYLTFTLPVKITTQINGKILISAFWTVMSTLAFSISLLMIGAGHGILEGFREVFNEIYKFFSYFDSPGSTTITIVLLILMLIIALFSGYLRIYASIAIGHLFRKHRILGAIGSYMGISMVLQIVSVMIMAISGFYNYSFRYESYNFIHSLNAYLVIMVIYNIILAAIYYFITAYVFGKKLNLE